MAEFKLELMLAAAEGEQWRSGLLLRRSGIEAGILQGVLFAHKQKQRRGEDRRDRKREQTHVKGKEREQGGLL